MHVYWGGGESGKAHLKHYAMHNDKTVLIWHQGNKSITKIYTTVHHQSVYWRDESVRKIVYHYIDGFRKCEKKTDSIYQHLPYKHNKSSMVQKDDRTTYYQLKRKRNYTQDEIKKYTQIEYINTNLYFDILKFVDQIGQEIPREELDYDDIFKDVDLLIFIPPEHVVEDNVELFQSSVNVIPYKSNILDCTIGRLDLFLSAFQESPFTDERENDLLESYYSDKNIIWNHLDEYKRQEDNVIRLLKKYDIPYQMFDLDTDSYKDTFGWEIELPRDYTHRRESWQDSERYTIIENIAKEYVSR
tara:strand:+ start:253 stop:1155 length:903 start_codon:yes stop_codon:yes gene_type:complete